MEANRFDSMTQAPPVMVDASQAIQVTIGERWTESTVREKWAWPLADLGDAHSRWVPEAHNGTRPTSCDPKDSVVEAEHGSER